MFIGCVNDTLTFQCSPSVSLSYELDIAPIVSTKCAAAGCHDGSNPAVPTLSNFTQVAGNANDIKFQIGNEAMPPSSSTPLTDSEKAKILCWIEQGEKN